MQANTCTLYTAKVGTRKHGTPITTYKGLKKEFCPTNNMEYKFWFCLNKLKYCVSGNKKKDVLYWPILPNTWLVKMGTRLALEEALALEDAGFQLQQGKVFSPHHRMSSIATLPIIRSHFHQARNLHIHPTSRIGKTMCCNLIALTMDHKNKWEGAWLTDGYYLVMVIVIPYPWFGVSINIVSKKDIAHCVTIGEVLQCTYPNLMTTSSHALGRKDNGCIAILLTCV